MKDYVILLRPKQWVNNLLVFCPAFFSNNLLSEGVLLWSVVIFVSFCFLSSSIYCFNDIKDAEHDRLHPIKKLRPISSGKLSVKRGYLMMVSSLLLSLVIPLTVDMPGRAMLYVILLVYYILNISYCMKLKHIAIIDVITISMGYVLRVFAGGVIGIWISQWIVLMTFLLALFLSLYKRRTDIVFLESTDMGTSQSLYGYNLTFINYSLAIILSITLVCYIMYTVSDEVIYRMGSSYLYLTTLWVLIAIFRILQRALVHVSTDTPVQLLYKDYLILICLFGWISSFAAIIYF